MKKINIILFSMFLFSISSQYTVANEKVADKTVATEVLDTASWTNYFIDWFPSLLGNDPRNKKISFLNDLNKKKLNILDNSPKDKVDDANKVKQAKSLDDDEAKELLKYENDERTYNEKTFFTRWTTASAYTWTQIGIVSTLSAVAVYKLYSAVSANKAAVDDDQL